MAFNLGNAVGEVVNFFDPTGAFLTEGERAEQARIRDARLRVQSRDDLRPQLIQQLGADEQAQALGLALQAAQGQAPSVAQNQLAIGQDRNVAQQFALAGSQGSPLAFRRAQQAAGLAGARTAQQAALLRAQEMAQARQLLGQIAGARRAQALNAVLGIDQTQQASLRFGEQARQADRQSNLDFLSSAGEAAATLGGAGGGGGG